MAKYTSLLTYTIYKRSPVFGKGKTAKGKDLLCGKRLTKEQGQQTGDTNLQGGGGAQAWFE